MIDMVKHKIIEMKKTDFRGEYEAYLDIYYRYEPEKINTLHERVEGLKKRIDLNFELYAEDGDKEGFMRRNDSFKQDLRIAEYELDKLINNKHWREKAQEAFTEYLTTLRDIDTENLTNKELKRLFNCIRIKQYGKSYNEKVDIKLLSFEFDFNFLGIPLSEMMKRIQESSLSESVQVSLLDKMRFFNFEHMGYKERGRVVPLI